MGLAPHKALPESKQGAERIEAQGASAQMVGENLCRRRKPGGGLRHAVHLHVFPEKPIAVDPHYAIERSHEEFTRRIKTRTMVAPARKLAMCSGCCLPLAKSPCERSMAGSVPKSLPIAVLSWHPDPVPMPLGDGSDKSNTTRNRTNICKRHDRSRWEVKQLCTLRDEAYRLRSENRSFYRWSMRFSSLTSSISILSLLKIQLPKLVH